MQQRARVPEIDGLRGLAILAVVYYHYVALAIARPGNLAAWVGYKLGLLGWAGVDLFFVLSGFLIGGIILDTRSRPDFFRSFYVRRACRIFPLYFALLFVLACLTNSPLHDTRGVPWIAYLTFTQNIWGAALTTYGLLGFAATWSLAVEEQFYLVLPAVLRRLSSRRLVTLLVSLIVLAPLFRAALKYGGIRYGPIMLLPARADTLAWGVLVAWLVRERTLWTVRRLTVLFAVLLTGVIAIALVQTKPYDWVVITIGYTWIGPTMATALLLGLHPGSWLAGWLRSRFLRHWAQIAYGVYLLHQPILRMIEQPLVALGVTWVVAQVSWRAFERPIIQYGHRATASPPVGASSRLAPALHTGPVSNGSGLPAKRDDGAAKV